MLTPLTASPTAADSQHVFLCLTPSVTLKATSPCPTKYKVSPEPSCFSAPLSPPLSKPPSYHGWVTATAQPLSSQLTPLPTLPSLHLSQRDRFLTNISSTILLKTLWPTQHKAKVLETAHAVTATLQCPGACSWSSTLGTPLPQGLCSGCSFCSEHIFPRCAHASSLTSFRSLHKLTAAY